MDAFSKNLGGLVELHQRMMMKAAKEFKPGDIPIDWAIWQLTCRQFDIEPGRLFYAMVCVQMSIAVAEDEQKGGE